MEELDRDEFEQGYAERSGVTVDYLHSMGQYAEPCDCGDVTCAGWAMVRIETPLQISK